MEATKTFLAKGSKDGEATGTLFIIDKGWGYDIQPYSLFPDEEEILLEPEKRFKVACNSGRRFNNHQPRDAGHATVSPRGVWVVVGMTLWTIKIPESLPQKAEQARKGRFHPSSEFKVITAQFFWGRFNASRCARKLSCQGMWESVKQRKDSHSAV